MTVRSTAEQRRAGVGVGAGVCRAVAEAGGRLVINGRSREALEAAVAKYPDAVGAFGDIRDPEQVAEIFETAERECGVVDGLVNNAGVGLSKPAHEVEEQEFDALYAVDVRAVWLMTRAFIRQLIAAKRGGAIVNVSSVHAHSTMPRYSIYAGAKAGIEGMTRGLAYEYGTHNIRCNAIAPGLIKTDFARALWENPERLAKVEASYPLRRIGDPDDIAGVAVFLASRAGQYVTGQTIVVDGGSTIVAGV